MARIFLDEFCEMEYNLRSGIYRTDKVFCEKRGIALPKKLLFIFNNRAGKSAIERELAGVIDIFTKGGCEVVAHPTQGAGDAMATVRDRGAAYETIVVAGGDGTLSEAVEGLMAIPEKDKIKLGYIPSGSTNDFAASLGIPKDVKAAAELIVRGKTFKCDIGRFNGRTFNYVAGCGAFTDVSYATPQGNKNMFGYFAYIIEGLSRLPKLPSYKMCVECDGKRMEGEFILGMVMNSNNIAGIDHGNIIKADLSDGLFELLLIRTPSNLIELQMTLGGLLSGKSSKDGLYCILKGREFKFSTEDDIKWTLDGDFGGSDKEVTISVAERAVNFIVAEDNPELLAGS